MSKAPGENTLRKNFQAIQDSTKAAQAVAEKAAAAKKQGQQQQQEQQRRSSRKEEIPEPGIHTNTILEVSIKPLQVLPLGPP